MGDWFGFLDVINSWFGEVLGWLESLLIFLIELFPLHGDSIPNLPDLPADTSFTMRLFEALSWVLPIQFCLNVALAMATFHVGMFVVNIALRWLKVIGD